MLAEAGQIREQSSNIELLVDSGAACRAWPCKVKPGSSQGRTFLTSTVRQGTMVFAVVMGTELGNKMCKNERDTSPHVQWCVSRACVGSVGALPSGGSGSMK